MNNWRQWSFLSSLDIRLADYLGTDDWSRAAVALTHFSLSQGHACLHLTQKPSLEKEELWLGEVWPAWSTWREKLASCSSFGTPNDSEKPLILENDGRLYLRRFWRYEQELISQLKRIEANKPSLPIDFEQRLETILANNADLAAGQKAALADALRNALLIVSGGPGTGKTTTVLRILNALSEVHTGDSPFRVALAAPTGKAAQRIQESIADGLSELAANQDFPDAMTLHRLLEYNAVMGRFRRNADRPLRQDLVIVDEASMLDLALMTQLACAIPAGGRLLLLGDKDQLSSVDAGSVLGDLVDAAGRSDSGPPSCWIPPVAVLTDYFRFDSASGIATLCESIRVGDVNACLQRLDNLSADDDLSWLNIQSESELDKYLHEQYIPALENRLLVDDPADALKALRERCLLSPLRRGPFGADSLNRKVMQKLSRQSSRTVPGHAVFHGCPVMITENDYEQNLFNGDLGVILVSENDGHARAYFPFSEDPGYRSLALEQLPAHDYAFAMTVHKSQGSEFTEACLVLPDRASPLLSRELLYTAVSRAREHAMIVGPSKILEVCIKNRTKRNSGLLSHLENQSE